MKRTASLLAAVAILLYFAAPSFAKKALDEGDLDRITAAGEPTIIQVSGVEIDNTTGTSSVEFEVSYIDASTDSLVVEGATNSTPGGQQDLRALVLNNIAGENLVANAVNVSASAQSNNGNQSNQITQSWGSVKITDVVTVTESVSVEGEDSDGGDVEINSGGCIGICAPKIVTTGDGETSPGSTALAAIAYPVWMAADVIVHIEDVEIDSAGEVEFEVFVLKNATTSMVVGAGAQSSLAALVVNNVAGKNLIANAINIQGGNITLGDGVVGHFIGQAGQGNTGGQSNTISQFRGTPANAPQPAVVGIATPTGCGISGFGQFSC